MSSYWKEKIFRNVAENIAYSIWLLVDSNTGCIIDKCYCSSQCCIDNVRECKASSHYCICSYRQTVIGRVRCSTLCKSNSHNCLCRWGIPEGNCKSKHIGKFICSCPNPNIICGYDSDDSDDTDSRQVVRIVGHICICITQGPDTCLAKIHMCSCDNAGFMECLYERPAGWPQSWPPSHKQTIKNIVVQELYCKNVITEHAILDIISDYADNANGLYCGPIGNLDAQIVYSDDSILIFNETTDLQKYMIKVLGKPNPYCASVSKIPYFDTYNNKIVSIIDELIR